MSDDSRRKGLRTFFIVVAAMGALALVAAVFMVTSVRPVAATAKATSTSTLSVQQVRPATTPADAATVAPRTTVTPTPTHSSAPVAPSPAVPSPAPMPTAPDAPAYAQARPAPVAPAWTPTQAPTCPPDGGVTLTMDSANVVSQGSAIDTLAASFTLENRQSVPVTLSTIDLIHVTGIRADGSEMSAGSLVLDFKYTYDVPPGRWSFGLDKDHYLMLYHGFGSPAVALRMDGVVRVANSAPDINANSRYCQFSDMQMGPPLRGNWGS